MQDADAFCYICVRSSYHFPIQLTIHQNGINTLLGLTLLTEPNLSLATTWQVDDLKKKNHPKKKIDP